jgi:hypothetical protein
MSRSARNDIASAISALSLASFGIFLGLAISYISARPTEQNIELGLVNVLKNHGTKVYISDTESTWLCLLLWTFFATFMATLVIVPKDFIVPPPATPRWITHVSARWRTDLSNPTPRLKVIFLCSLVFSLAAIYFIGPAVAGLLIARGVLLHL